MDLFAVYEAGICRHLSDIAVLNEVATVVAHPRRIISDAAAQTIAAWWHSPDSPLSTMLSTTGKVDRRMNRETFASDAEYKAPMVAERESLDALVKYIEHHIASAPSSARPCACRDCMYLTVGIIGEMCSHCEDAGCEYGASCEVEGAYDTIDCD